MNLEEALAVLASHGIHPYRLEEGWLFERNWPTDAALMLEARAFKEGSDTNMKWQSDKPTKPGWYWVKVKKLLGPEYVTVCDWKYLQSWQGGHQASEIIATAGPIREPNP